MPDKWHHYRPLVQLHIDTQYHYHQRQLRYIGNDLPSKEHLEPRPIFHTPLFSLSNIPTLNHTHTPAPP